MTVYRHIVLFKLHEDTTEAERQKAFELLIQLGKGHAGLLSWHVNWSIDTRKGHIICEEAEFDSRQAFEDFRLSKAHGEVAEFMREVSDWWVADYLAA